MKEEYVLSKFGEKDSAKVELSVFFNHIIL